MQYSDPSELFETLAVDTTICAHEGYAVHAEMHAEIKGMLACKLVHAHARVCQLQT